MARSEVVSFPVRISILTFIRWCKKRQFATNNMRLFFYLINGSPGLDPLGPVFTY